MEEEAEKLKEMQNEVEKQMNLSSPGIGKITVDQTCENISQELANYM